MDNIKTTICDCGHTATSNGGATGYGVTPEGKKICYSCCAEEDKQHLRDNGKLSGYLTGEENNMMFGNWPSTFTIKVQRYRKSWHNFAGRNGRTDFWVTWEGNTYHGVNIGDNQCTTIRKVKR